MREPLREDLPRASSEGLLEAVFEEVVGEDVCLQFLFFRFS